MRRILFVLLFAATAVGAQDRAEPRQRRADATQRDSLEARVRVRMSRILKEQLGLDDEQVRRLQATNQQFEGRRRTLLGDERESRMALRRELQRGDSARQEQVATHLDRLMQLQRQRFELLEAEQKELATFLTPVQRARLFGMEEQLRRRMEDVRDRRPGPGQAGQAGQPGGQRPQAPPRRPPR